MKLTDSRCRSPAARRENRGRTGTPAGARALTRRRSGWKEGAMEQARTAAAALVLSLTGAGCLVQITHVSDPSAAFHEARLQAERLTGRPGPAHELNVLVWSPGDRELVRVSLPMWIVRRAERHVDWDDARIEGDARDH